MPEIQCSDCGNWCRIKPTAKGKARRCLACSKIHRAATKKAYRAAHLDEHAASNAKWLAKAREKSLAVQTNAARLSARYEEMGRPKLSADVWLKLAAAVKFNRGGPKA